MRRLDLHPRKKLRNPARHIRSLARWAETAGERAYDGGGLFANLKLPVFSKLVNPPHTTRDIQRACITLMMRAAQAIRRDFRSSRPYRIACLISTPDLWGSEVTLFFDEDYFATFLPPAVLPATARHGTVTATSDAPRDDLIERFGLTVPQGLEYRGGYRLCVQDADDPECGHEEHRWVICEANPR